MATPRSALNRATSVYHLDFRGADLDLLLKRCPVLLTGSTPTPGGAQVQVRVADDETAVSVAKHMACGAPFQVRTGTGVHLRLVHEEA